VIINAINKSSLLRESILKKKIKKKSKYMMVNGDLGRKKSSYPIAIPINAARCKIHKKTIAILIEVFLK
jgi:Iap family predicted aminopeptidase